jgi:hypothetical protein
MLDGAAGGVTPPRSAEDMTVVIEAAAGNVPTLQTTTRALTTAE